MNIEVLFEMGIGTTICRHLTLGQVGTLMRTSKTMYEHIRSDSLIWRRFVREDPIANR
jgi:hypothetical protein